MEELGGEKTHVDVMLQFLEEAGLTREEADRAEPAPGTAAAIEMIVGCCQRRTALGGIAILSFVEAMHGGPDGAAAGMFEAMTKHYGLQRARSGDVRAPRRAGHRARRPPDRGDPPLRARRRDAGAGARRGEARARAFNLEWDGHVQAMTGERTYWRGLAPRIDLHTPDFRLPR